MPKRHLLDSDSDEVLPARPSKHVRRSARLQDDDDDEDMGDVSVGERFREGVDVESEGEGGDEEDDDDEEDDEDEVERFPDHSVVNEKGLACSGVLESVTVKNLMCHEHLVFKLGRNVNIINGPNGSGKSAIVAAIQVGLGARAISTERGSGVDQFIAYESNEATTIIHIRNEVNQLENDAAGAEESDRDDDESDGGGNAGGRREKAPSADYSTYRHDVYGNAIEIVRNFKRGGTSTWSVRNYRRKVVKDELGGISPRAEIRNICDHFGFMVDSPTTVLTQTNSKKFLGAAKPTEHHELYRKATLLGPLEDEYNGIKKVVDQIGLMIKQKEDMRPAVKQQLTDLQVAFEDSEEMKNLSTRVKEHGKMLLWTEADEAECELNKFRAMLEDDFQPDLTQCLNKEKKLKKSIDELKESLSNGETEMSDASVKTDALQQVLKKASKELFALEAGLKRKEAQDVTADEDIRQARDSIEKSKAELEAAKNLHLGGQESKAHIADDLQKCSANILKAEQEEEQATQDASAAADVKESSRRGIGLLEQRLRDVAQEHERKRKEASQQRAETRNTNSVGRFGREFSTAEPLIRQAIGQNKFHYPPLGPVGQFLTVKDDFWAATIQDAVHPNSLKTFLVGDRHDMEELRKVFKGARCYPSKIVVVNGGLGRQPRHNITQQDIPRVHELGHCTVLDQIDVSNDDVFNFFVDHCNVETHVLVRGKQDMLTVSRNRNLRNVNTCWDEHGNRAYEKGYGHTSRDTHRRPGAKGVLSVDREAFACELEAAANALADDRRLADGEVREAKRNLQALDSGEREAVRHLRSLRDRLRKLVKEKAVLEEKREEASSEFDPVPFELSIESFTSDLIDSEKEKATLGEELAKASDEAKTAKERREKAFLDHKKAKGELGAFIRKLNSASSRFEKENVTLRIVVKAKKKKETRIEKALREISDQQAAYLKKLEIAKAVQESRPEMDHGKSSAKIEAELQSMETRLEAEKRKRDGKSADEIEKEFLQAQSKDMANLKLIKRIKGYHNSITNGLAIRKLDEAKLEKVAKKLVRNNFRGFMHKRGHTGNISFSVNDNNQQELKISTKMGSHKTGDGGLHETKDLKSLSGGERSFTTLSFMMALAGVCQNPVRHANIRFIHHTV